MQVITNEEDIVKILYISKSVTKFLPYEPDYIQQHPRVLKELTDHDELERVSWLRKQAIKKHTALDIDVRLKSIDGTQRWANFIVQPHSNEPDFTIWDCMFTDITERKKSEDEYRLLSEVVTNMADGVCLISAKDARFLYTNPNFDKMFGYDTGELIGKHVSIVNARTEKDPEQTAAEIIADLNKKGSWEGEVFNIKKDGTQFWSNSTVSVFEHHLYGLVWVTVQKDISAAKKVVKELEAQHLHNQRLVTELFIKDRDNERSRIAIELHEEINQLLSSAKLYLGQLLKDSSPDLNLQLTFSHLQNAIKRVDDLYQSVSTPFVSGIGFVESVNMLIEKFNQFDNMNVSVISNADTLDHLSADLKLMLYNSIEQYCSFVKENEPEMASVTIHLLTTPENQLELQLLDCGKSAYRLEETFDENYKKMQSRVGFFGGTITSQTTQNGFEVDISIPLS